jgi:biopolymer transport protein ExbB
MELTELFLRFSVNYGAEWVMWLLIGLSGVSFYLIIDRAIFFVRYRTNVTALSQDVSKALAAGDAPSLMSRLKGEKGIVARILAAGVRESENGHAAAEQAIGGEKTRQKIRCERNLAVLATIGNNAPFIGLFGTVIGVLVAFHRFSSDTTGGAGAVMADISEALAATAIGLFVAIPAVAAFNAFQRRTKGLLATADSLASQLLTALQAKDGGETPDVDRPVTATEEV